MPPVIIKALITLLLSPFASQAKAILDKLGLQYVNVSVPQRIGHLALETDSFLRDYILKNGRPPVAVMIEPANNAFANPTLVKYLSRYITIIPRSAVRDRIDKALVDGGYAISTAPYAVAMYETALCYDVFRRWGQRAPLFKLTRSDKKVTTEFLRKIGVPEGAWFICVHARSGGYSPSDEHWHSHRNVDITDYAEAMDRVIARGGWCIRMGDATMAPMPKQDRVIDYACSEHKSPALDIGLVASCRFFLGCASGLYNIAAIFGRPSALVNMTPLSGSYGFGAEDLAVPQNILDDKDRILPISEIFMSEIANFRLAEEFKARELKPQNVSPAAIAELAEEMMDRLDGLAEYTDDDTARQDKFRSYLRPGHYAYGTGSRIGRDYLRANASLD